MLPSLFERFQQLVGGHVGRNIERFGNKVFEFDFIHQRFVSPKSFDRNEAENIVTIAIIDRKIGMTARYRLTPIQFIVVVNVKPDNTSPWRHEFRHSQAIQFTSARYY